MTKEEKAIREFCGQHADWWPSITQVQEMLALAHPKQEPAGQLLEDAFGRGQVMWFNKPKDESMLYTTPPQIEVGCAECGVGGGHALYCVTCAENYLKDKNTRGQANG